MTIKGKVPPIKIQGGIKRIHLNQFNKDTDIFLKVLEHSTSRYSAALGSGARTKEARLEYFLKISLKKDEDQKDKEETAEADDKAETAKEEVSAKEDTPEETPTEADPEVVKADEAPIEELETPPDVEDSKEEVSDKEDISEEKPTESDAEEVKVDKESNVEETTADTELDHIEIKQ